MLSCAALLLAAACAQADKGLVLLQQRATVNDGKEVTAQDAKGFEDDIDGLNEQVQSLEGRLNEMQRSYTASVAAKRSAFQAEVAKRHDLVVTMQQDNKKLSMQLRELEKSNKQLRSHVDEVNESNKNLHTFVLGFERNVSGAAVLTESLVKKADAELDETKSPYLAVFAEYDKLEQERNKTKLSLLSMTRKEVSREGFGDLDPDGKELLKTLMASVDQLTKEHRDSETKLEASFQQERETEQKKIDGLHAENLRLREKISQQEELRNRLKESLQNLEVVHKHLSDDSGALQSYMGHISEEVDEDSS